MIVLTDSIEITSDMSLSLMVLVTLANAIVFGLAVVPRPSRATIAWGAAFGIGLFGTYLWVAAGHLDSPPLRALASGIMLGFEPLVWLGLRLFAGRRPPFVEAITFLVIVPTVLALTATSSVFPIVFRVAFVLAGVVAALIAIDLGRLRSAPRDILLPLMLVSGAFVVTAVLALASGIIAPEATPSETMSLLRQVNGMGAILTSLCAAVTIVLLVRTEDRRSRDDGQGDRSRILRDRLERARAQGESPWSLLDIHLDDPGDLREATSSADFATLVETYHARVIAGLPASADIVSDGGGRVRVLLPGSEEAVESSVRNVLASISRIDDEDESDAPRVSASVGWATTASGYDYDELVALAAAGAERARVLGGDRWERMTKAQIRHP